LSAGDAQPPTNRRWRVIMLKSEISDAINPAGAAADAFELGSSRRHHTSAFDHRVRFSQPPALARRFN